MADDTSPSNWTSQLITDGEWAGWRYFGVADPFEALTGPYYYRVDAEGRMRCGFLAEPKHMNGAGFMHGGCIMTFADFALFMIAEHHVPGVRGVTATLNGEFSGSVRPGDLVEASGEVTKAGRSLIFARGLITTRGEPVMSFSGLIKRVSLRR